MIPQTSHLTAVAQAVADSHPDLGADDVVVNLGSLWPDLRFKPVLSRGGWYRSGGVVDMNKQRVADSLRGWAEQVAGDDLGSLLDHCIRKPLFATRLLGRTHYLTAPTGPAPADFIQLEIEELQEVLERYLSDPDWLPDSLEEFIDPLEYAVLEPEPVGAPRLVFRRFFAAREILNPLETSSTRGLSRFMCDWADSSASRSGHFCERWALGIRESSDAVGESIVDAHPIAVDSIEHAPYTPGLSGAELAGWIHNFDHLAGYPMAWYFHMVSSSGVPHAVGVQVVEDHDKEFSYIPRRDLELLRRWVERPYSA